MWMYNFLSEASFRTHDPNEATLFYIPIFPTRRLHLKQPKVGWQDAIAASAHDVKWGVHWVKEHWNYWRLNNGADHFTVLAGDHGRCTHMSRLTKEDVGDLFVFQHLGDLTLWNGDESVIHATAWPPQPEAGQYWPCYRPNHDILLPSCVLKKQVPVVSPFHARREISALFRFEPEAATANHPYHHVNIRRTLKDQFEKNPIRGADWRHYQGLNSTLQDMANSTLCMIPPGIVRTHADTKPLNVLSVCASEGCAHLSALAGDSERLHTSHLFPSLRSAFSRSNRLLFLLAEHPTTRRTSYSRRNYRLAFFAR
jgi:hypothetical protein